MSAAEVSASASGTLGRPKVPLTQQIKTVKTTVDEASGTWTTTVRFRAAQSAATARDLVLNLAAEDGPANRGTWLLRTDPNATQATYTPSTPPMPGTEPVAAASFDPSRTLLTLRATDPQLVGIRPDVVRVDLNDRGETLSGATAFLGPVAPRPTIPKAARRLTAQKDGVVRVPLTALPRPAERFVRIYTASGFRLAAGYLSAHDYRSTVVELRVPQRELRRLSKQLRTGRLTVRTQLPNTSEVVVKRTVRLRRS